MSTDNDLKNIQAEADRPRNKKIDDAYAAYVAEQNNMRIRSDAKSLFFVAVASFVMAANIKFFINQGGLLPGGVNGMAILLQRIALKFGGFELPFSPLSLTLNAIPAYLAFKTVGKKFTAYSCICIVLMSFLTDLIPDPKAPVTDDRLLLSVFGGIINGGALSMILNSGASSGGSDFVAMYFSVKKGISTWNYVLMFNAVIILISGILFGMDGALYTIIFQFCQTQMLNTFYKKYYKKTVFIITDKPEAVTDGIMSITHHATTVFKAEGAYTGRDHYVVYVILSADELHQVRRAVRSVDAKAFINVLNSENVFGNFFIKPVS